MMYVWITHYGGKFKDSEFEGFDVQAFFKGIEHLCLLCYTQKGATKGVSTKGVRSWDMSFCSPIP